MPGPVKTAVRGPPGGAVGAGGAPGGVHGGFEAHLRRGFHEYTSWENVPDIPHPAAVTVGPPVEKTRNAQRLFYSVPIFIPADVKQTNPSSLFPLHQIECCSVGGSVYLKTLCFARGLGLPEQFSL